MLYALAYAYPMRAHENNAIILLLYECSFWGICVTFSDKLPSVKRFKMPYINYIEDISHFFYRVILETNIFTNGVATSENVHFLDQEVK